jgi:hypothetical protein
VLASSQFNGMDGIELGGVEIGRIGSGSSSGTTDQDVQSDIQDSQDGLGDSIDTSGRAGAQYVVTSPRRTRSGKLVKYKDE